MPKEPGSCARACGRSLTSEDRIPRLSAWIPGGNVENFVMNDKCAAGTGRFLEMMARTMELSLEETEPPGTGVEGRY